MINIQRIINFDNWRSVDIVTAKFFRYEGSVSPIFVLLKQAAGNDRLLTAIKLLIICHF